MKFGLKQSNCKKWHIQNVFFKTFSWFLRDKILVALILYWKMLDVSLIVTFHFWGTSNHNFYNFYKSYCDSIIKIEKCNWFLISEPNPWQLTWLTYSQMRCSKEQRKQNVDFYLSRYVNMYLILTFIKNKDKHSFEFYICCFKPDMFDWSLSH